MGRSESTRKPISTNAKVMRNAIKLEKGPQYHNVDLLIRLIGDANEINIIIDGSVVRY